MPGQERNHIENESRSLIASLINKPIILEKECRKTKLELAQANV